METFNYNYPMFAMFMSLMFTANTQCKNHSFIYTIKTIYNTIKLELFRYRYTNWKWFRKRAIKKFRKSLVDPFMVFSFDQLLIGNAIDYENKQERERYIEQYIKDNGLSEEDSIKLKNSIDGFVKQIIEKRSKEENV